MSVSYVPYFLKEFPVLYMDLLSIWLQKVY